MNTLKQKVPAILGKSYRTRGGKIVGPIERSNCGTNYKFAAWVQEDEYPDKSRLSWLADGSSFLPDWEKLFDLVEQL